MEEMAVNSQVSWRFPLSPTLRDNDCFEQEQSDLFQNLEKLIDSAVSICRLNGSLQCQIGGLITVIEELQRLLRHSFSEINKLEKSLDHQKHNSSSKISVLQKQMIALEYSVAKCKSSDVTAPPSVLQEEPRNSSNLTPRSSSNSEQCIFQGENDVSQSVEEVHVSLVDESYGNEESDNNLDDQADNTKDDKVVVADCANGEATCVDLSKEASFADKNEDDASQVESTGEMAETHLEDQSQGSADTISSDRTFEFSLIETTSDVSEEMTPRNLRNSKQMIDSKSSGENPSSKRRKCRSESTSKDNHQLVKNSLPKKRGRKAKKSSQDNSFMRKDQKRGNQIRTTSPKNSKSFKRKEEVQKSNDSTQNSKKSTIVNWPLLQEIKRETDIDTTVPETKEKLVDRAVNLDFLLTVNQVMSDLVSDEDQEEAALDQVNELERKEVVNLAKLYHLRVRMAGKCEGELPVVLVKGRESCLPKPGEVDSLLSTKSDTLNRRQAGMLKKFGNKHKFSMETNSPSRDQNARSKSKKRRF